MNRKKIVTKSCVKRNLTKKEPQQSVKQIKLKREKRDRCFRSSLI